MNEIDQYGLMYKKSYWKRVNRFFIAENVLMNFIEKQNEESKVDLEYYRDVDCVLNDMYMNCDFYVKDVSGLFYSQEWCRFQMELSKFNIGLVLDDVQLDQKELLSRLENGFKVENNFRVIRRHAKVDKLNKVEQ